METKTIDPGYKLMVLPLGSNVKTAVETLLKDKAIGQKTYCIFNGEVLYSDTVTMDSAYLSITGMTHEEFNIYLNRTIHEASERRALREKQMTSLAEDMKSKGREVLSEDKWETWDFTVPVRISDLYGGKELIWCLDIVRVLNNGGTLEEAKKVMDTQDHFGASWNMVRYMVRMFADRGDEFYDYRG